ncbi:MAG: hypothetical protein H7281_06790 [Bacteriovorax sp.]|nr:hypothetical protein [Bacteriovorax sp.]
MYTKIAEIKIFIGLILISSLAPAAHASESKYGLFVEPAITYEVGDNTVNFPSPLSNSTGSTNGLGLGARVGFHLYDVLFLGLDGRFSMPNFKNSSRDYDASSVAANWGPVIGMQTPVVGLRVWGSIILGGSLDPERSGNFDVKFTDGSGFRIGAGFLVSLVSLNLEYQHIDYDKTTLEQIGPFSSGTTLNGVNLENNSIIASVSFPYAL